MSNPPCNLGNAGKRFWRSVTGPFELGPDELELLRAACETLDELDLISEALRNEPATVKGSRGQPIPNPLFNEARSHRLVLNRLLKTLDLPSEDEQPESQTTLMARKAAQARWSAQREVDGLRKRGAS